MPSQPLQPFSPPTILLSHFPSGLTNGLTTWLLCAVYVFWAVYTIVAIYHWVRYSHASGIAFPAIGLHLFVSVSLMLYALSNSFAL